MHRGDKKVFMNITYHFQQRMNQRGITKAMIDCVVHFGRLEQDKYVINKKMANAYIAAIQNELMKRRHKDFVMKVEKHLLCNLADLTQFTTVQLEDLLKQMKKIADKQGVSMVMEDGNLITTYNTCSYRRKLSKHYH